MKYVKYRILENIYKFNSKIYYETDPLGLKMNVWVNDLKWYCSNEGEKRYQMVYFLLFKLGSIEDTDIIDLFAFFYFQSTLVLFCILLCSLLFYILPGDLEIKGLDFSPFFSFLLLTSIKFRRFKFEKMCLFLLREPVLSFLPDVLPITWNVFAF